MRVVRACEKLRQFPKQCRDNIQWLYKASFIGQARDTPNLNNESCRSFDDAGGWLRSGLLCLVADQGAEPEQLVTALSQHSLITENKISMTIWMKRGKYVANQQLGNRYGMSLELKGWHNYENRILPNSSLG